MAKSKKAKQVKKIKPTKRPFAKKPVRPAKVKTAQPKMKAEAFQPSDWSQSRKGTKRSAAQQPLRGGKKQPTDTKKQDSTTSAESSTPNIQMTQKDIDLLLSPAAAAAPPAEPREMLVCANCGHQFEDGGPESVTSGDPCPVCQDRNDEGVLELREVAPSADPMLATSKTANQTPLATSPSPVANSLGTCEPAAPRHNLIQVAFNGGKRYTYDAGALDLKVGDMVEVQLGHGNRIVRVEQLGSDYAGPAKSVIRKVEDENSADPQSTARELTGGSSAASPQTVQNDRPTSGLVAHLASRLVPSAASSSDAAPHLIVEARAGTGKTTTLVEGLKLLKGIGSTLTPSPQQKAVWDSICLSKDAKTVCFVAFNKSIATELQRRVPAGCDAQTMHSMGLKAVTKSLGRLEVNQYVVQDIIAELVGSDLKELRRTKPVLLKATEDLVSLCKMNLVNGIGYSGKLCGRKTPEGLTESTDWGFALDELASHYEVNLNSSRAAVFELVPRVLERCREPAGRINFDDMIWLPVVLNLPVFRYDLLLVDEAQDLNRCQQALAKRAGKRLILCGDPKQAIYGFAGADAESMKRMTKELGWVDDTDPAAAMAEVMGEHRGCVTLPLTVTRRCGKAIVQEARQLVPDFEAFETNPEGKISDAMYPVRERADGTKEELPWEKTYMAQAAPGDMVLCRVNAPLVSNCFRFLKRSIKATIQGRDVGAGLISTVNKLCKPLDPSAVSIPTLIQGLSKWLSDERAKENAKKNPNDAKLIALSDRYECLVCFCEVTSGRFNEADPTVESPMNAADAIRKIETVFTDDKDAPGIRLSSIHKAKGLESRRVFFLRPKGAGCPHPMSRSPWQLDQERNLCYVAITRAIEELVYVS